MKELDSTPHKYQEISNNILAGIEEGTLRPGERLQSVRALGIEYGCNYHTVRHAFKLLAEQGYLEQKPGSGTFVTHRAADYKKRVVSAEKELKTTDRIGVILPLKHWGHYVTSLIGQLHQTAENMGLNLYIRTVSNIDIDAAKIVRELMGQDCCAIILPWVGEDQHAAGLHDFIRASRLPVVIANPAHGLEENCYWDAGSGMDLQQSDTFLQCNYLRRIGYSNIALLGLDAEDSEYFQRKLLEYSRWCDAEDFLNLIGMVDRTPADYKRIIGRWDQYRGDLAVIAYHDEIALEFMNAAHAEGLSVPDDVAVLGHNNNPNGLRSNPSLSTVLLPYEYIAKGMVNHALALSRGQSGKMIGRTPPSLFIRESCGGLARLGQHGVDAVLEELAGSSTA